MFQLNELYAESRAHIDSLCGVAIGEQQPAAEEEHGTQEAALPGIDKLGTPQEETHQGPEHDTVDGTLSG